ncbi:sensor histidine kinase [Roseobacter sp. HKCCA0434]|uniref:sensor histidine kinase n=1 Tax=Roseobacter sp. HKCCA0434 TaxID=3079297 RepID=UPI002905C04F|nr:ATP-binding protein [Roseobacter sp. HKCCA0434]
MPPWPQILVLATAALVAGYAAQGGAGAGGVMLAVGIAGGLAILALRVLMPPQVEQASGPADRVSLPRGAGRQLLEQVPGPIFVIDARGRIIYFNRAAREMAPRLPNGAHVSQLYRAPAFVEAVGAILDGAVEAEIAFSASTVTGEAQLSAQLRRLEGEAELGPGPMALLQVSDQTDRMATERMRTDFIANASHELRTPLASIIGYIETLQGHARDDPQAREHFLTVMARQAARMQRLVEDLMSLSRIEMSAHAAPTDRVDLPDLIHEVVDGMAPLVRRMEATLDVEEVPDCTLCADRDQLGQVITNLVDNALKYGGTGAHVRLFAADADPRYPGLTGVTIADDGPGIAREHLPRLTERFYRVNAKQSMEKGGTGLGLAIVKHILARHGGELGIESEPGEGSRFTLWLPCLDPEDVS